MTILNIQFADRKHILKDKKMRSKSRNHAIAMTDNLSIPGHYLTQAGLLPTHYYGYHFMVLHQP